MCEPNFGILSNYEKAVIVTENKEQLASLEKYGKFVIHCKTEEQADEFFKMFKELVPDKFARWRAGDTRWDWYDKDTCYALHLFDNTNLTLQFSPTRYWNRVGYDIVPFEEIKMSFCDLGEIHVDEHMLKNLLYEIGV